MAYKIQSGMAGYDRTGNWGWEFYPPPFDFLAPRNAASMPAPMLRAGGLAGCHCGGTCGGCGEGTRGMGFFDTGLDISGWGAAEWLTAVAGVFVVRAVFGQTSRDAKSVRRRVYRRREAEKVKRVLDYSR